MNTNTTFKFNPRIFANLALSALCFVLGGTTQAGTLFWDGNGSGASGGPPPTAGVGGGGTWDTNTTANWWNGTGYQVWNAAGGEDIADFRVAGGAVTNTSGQAPRANKLNIAVNSVTFSGGTVAFTGSPGIIDVNNTSGCTFSSGATGSLKVMGTGQTASLASAAPFAILGSTTLGSFELALNQDQNHIILGNAAALGSAGSTVKLTKGVINLGNTSGSSTFNYLAWPTDLAGGTIRARFDTGTWNGATSLSTNSQLMTRNAAGVGLIFSTNATINLNSNTLNVMPGSSSSGITLNGVISGAGNLAFVNNTLGGSDNGTGILTLGAANTFSGTATTTLNLGTLALTNVNALQNATLDTGASGSQQVTFIVAGNNTYNLGALAGSDALAIDGNTISVGTKAVDTTFNGAISGVGGVLTKVGNHTLTLGGLNTYDGATTIAGGKLVGVVGGACANSVVTVNSGSGNTLGVLINNNTKGWTNAGVTFAAGTTALQFDFGNTVAPSGTVSPMEVNGNVDFTSTPTVIIKGGNLPAGDYPLITWTGTSGTPPATASLPARVGGGTLSVSNSTLYLNITGSTQPIAWTGGNGTWDLNNTANTNIWKDSAGAGSPTYYQETTPPGDSVVFDDTYGTGGTVTLNATVSPASVTVSNVSANYAITGSGAIAGTTALVKNGTAALTVGTTNSFTGGILLAEGTLRPGNSGAFNGTGVLTMSGTGALDLGGFDAAFTNLPASVAANTITNTAAGAGTNTLTIAALAADISALVADDGSRKVALSLSGGNNFNLLNTNNTFSGGLILGPSMRINAVNNSPVTGGPFGKGPVTIGTAAQIWFAAPDRTIGNDIIVNSAVGNGSRAGSFRIFQSNAALTGTITANQAPATFSADFAGATLTVSGRLTGTNGMTANLSSGAGPFTMTLSNVTVNPNDYQGTTTVGANTTVALAAPGQIPNGAGRGNASLAGTLDLNGLDETINGLSGAGVVDNVNSGSANTLTLGDADATGNNFSGIVRNTFGTLGLTKLGLGTQILSGANTYAGGTLISAGTLQIGNAGATGTLSPGSAITNHGTLAFNRTGTLTQGTDFASGISGSGSLVQAGSGTTILNTANSHAGLTTVSAGVLTVQDAGALGTAGTGTIVTNSARVEVQGGITITSEPITLNGAGGNFFGALQGTTGENEWQGPVTIGSQSGTRIGVNGGTFTVSGPIGGSTATNGLTLRPNNGTLIIAGANDYAGDTIIVCASAIVKLAGGNDRLPAGTKLLLGTGTTSGFLDLNGVSQEVAGISVLGGTANYVTNSSATTVTLTVNTPVSLPSTNAVVIAGALNLVKTGADTLTLTAANTYTGNTTVNAGTLVLQQATLATNSTVTVTNAAVLQLDFAATNTVAALVLNGASQSAGVYDAASSSPYLAGVGALEVVPNTSIPTTGTNLSYSIGGGQITLSWPSNYVGWYLQKQTNSRSIGLSNNWVTIPGTETVTQTNFPVTATDPTVFFRMVHTNTP